MIEAKGHAVDSIRKAGADCLDTVATRIGMAYCGTHSRLLRLAARRPARPLPVASA